MSYGSLLLLDLRLNVTWLNTLLWEILTARLHPYRDAYENVKPHLQYSTSELDRVIFVGLSPLRKGVTHDNQFTLEH